MWQQIIVVGIVVLAALYIIRRNWKRFRAGKGDGPECGGGCESCKQRAGCPLDQKLVMRPDQKSPDADKK
ncbi:MAG: FeoB-associated Cys-rich membrane protein [Desulfobacteraceae bacterium]|jgi:hypothetical protein|nr:FeoB-associated Cys-rich membrane protein [Desulfobacteraceae bacterium]